MQPVRRQCTMQRRSSVMQGASTRLASSAVSRPALPQQRVSWLIWRIVQICDRSDLHITPPPPAIFLLPFTFVYPIWACIITQQSLCIFLCLMTCLQSFFDSSTLLLFGLLADFIQPQVLNWITQWQFTFQVYCPLHQNKHSPAGQ